MTATKETVAQQVCHELASLGDVTTRKMFGGIGLFLDGVMFAKVTGEGILYFRVDDTNRAAYEAHAAGAFRSTAKKKGMPYYQVPASIRQHHPAFIEWAATAHAVARAHKK